MAIYCWLVNNHFRRRAFNLRLMRSWIGSQLVQVITLLAFVCNETTLTDAGLFLSGPQDKTISVPFENTNAFRPFPTPYPHPHPHPHLRHHITPHYVRRFVQSTLCWCCELTMFTKTRESVLNSMVVNIVVPDDDGACGMTIRLTAVPNITPHFRSCAPIPAVVVHIE